MLSHFRVEFYDCLCSRADALFELTDAVLCADGPATSPGELTLTAECWHGRDAMYDTVNHGWVEPRRLRRDGWVLLGFHRLAKRLVRRT